MALGSSHLAFEKWQLECAVLTAEERHCGVSRNVQLTTVDGLLQGMFAVSHLVVGCSALSTKGHFLSSRGVGLAVCLARSLAKKVVLVAETYKVTGEMLMGTTGLDLVKVSEVDLILSEESFVTMHSLAMLFAESK